MNFFILYWVPPEPPAAENQVVGYESWPSCAGPAGSPPKSWACKIGGSSGTRKSLPYLTSLGTLCSEFCSRFGCVAPAEEAAIEFYIPLVFGFVLSCVLVW